MQKPKRELLLANHPDGHHHIKGQTLVGKRIEIGKGKSQDFILNCTLLDCEIAIFCGASHVNIFASTLQQCTIQARREMKGWRLTDCTLQACVFEGKYSGCRFGAEDETSTFSMQDCDFSAVRLLDFCEFGEGVMLKQIKWPAWPHIVITDLPQSRENWLALALPAALASAQQIIGEEDAPWRAVSLYLPAHLAQFDALRESLATEPYIIKA
ncbi:hypothetical protein V8J88_01055 [Massilia sp. W12]|uniref:hypothetical protein n=1 Tax=Massilia sp. W12 TaxID=3126507 RepID=UPI0030CD0F50